MPFKQLIIFFTDVNECANGTHNNCDENAQCTDTPRSFNCTCNTGYEGNGLNCTSKQIKIDKGGENEDYFTSGGSYSVRKTI